MAARNYYECAANMGDTDAMNEVARCYDEGDGGRKDRVGFCLIFTVFLGACCDEDHALACWSRHMHSLCPLPTSSTRLPHTHPLSHTYLHPTNNPNSTKQPNTTASPNPKAAKHSGILGTLLRLLFPPLFLSLLFPTLPLQPSPHPSLPSKAQKKLTPPTQQDLERQIHPQRSLVYASSVSLFQLTHTTSLLP